MLKVQALVLHTGIPRVSLAAETDLALAELAPRNAENSEGFTPLLLAAYHAHAQTAQDIGGGE